MTMNCPMCFETRLKFKEIVIKKTLSDRFLVKFVAECPNCGEFTDCSVFEKADVPCESD